MVCAFIFHVLGVNADHRGLYGPTSAYYAAVEQQGRLTLHLHTMLWIRGAPSPQTMRERLLADDSEFEKEMIRYLDEMQTGQLLTGSMEAVKERMPIKPQGKNEEADIHHLHKPEDRQSASHAPTEPAEDPTQTMPVPPPAPCKCGVRNCACELKRRTWWKSFRETVDNLILRVQIHKCIRKRAARKADMNSTGKKDPLEGIKGCKGDDNICDARFPREYIEQSFVDRMTGAIHLMKREVMMNSVTPVLTYLTRSNTDTTSLQSGTSMKAIVMYVSDYITKCSLKTYHIMSCIKSVFERNAPSFEGSTDDNKSARKLMVQMVNALAPRMEIGSPLAASYVLDLPDHYKSHEYIVFWWKSYVNRVLEDCPDSARSRTFEERIVLRNEHGELVGTSIVDDYIYRPTRYENYSLFEWVQCSKKSKRTPAQMKKFLGADDDAPDDEEDLLAAAESDQPSLPDVLPVLPRIPRVVPLMDRSQNSPMQVNRRPIYEEFLPEHPQYNSHHVWCDQSKREYIIPNFVGGSLPRNDQGDREYYCATMLTLFMPWRKGTDLKRPGYNWDNSFKMRNFSEREKQLMANFNLKYECADARDDFRNELKKKKKAVAINADTAGDEDDDNDETAWYGEDLELDVPDDGETGPKWNRRQETVDMARTYASVSRWVNYVPGEGRDAARATFKPTKTMRGSQWAAYVDNLKQSLFRERTKNMPRTSTAASADRSTDTVRTPETGVKILPPSYFSSEYAADKPDLESLQEDIINQFKLNQDQQRAFTLISNHA
ncbi:hypothetical protein EV714DRAFT_194597, partial [Schizophyllum commune]